MLKNLSFKREYVSYVLVLLFGLFMIGMAVNAASTISTNISTGGTLTVTGAFNASSTLAISDNMTVVAGYGLDTAGSGILNLGTTTATTINIGRSGQTVALLGNATLVGTFNASSTLATSRGMTVVAGYGLDTAGGGQLNIGTTTATSVIIGSAAAKVGVGATTTPLAALSVNTEAGSPGFVVGSTTATHLIIDKNGFVGVASSSPYVALGVVGTTTASGGMIIGGSGNGISHFLFGTCTPTIGSLAASTSVSAICTGSAAVTGTGYRVFVTPNINGASNEDRNIQFVSASSTASGIQVTVRNENFTGVGAIDPTDNAWAWMAVR